MTASTVFLDVSDPANKILKMAPRTAAVLGSMLSGHKGQYPLQIFGEREWTQSEAQNKKPFRGGSGRRDAARAKMNCSFQSRIVKISILIASFSHELQGNSD